jgi:hypothetical protein
VKVGGSPRTKMRDEASMAVLCGMRGRLVSCVVQVLAAEISKIDEPCATLASR